MINVTFFEIWFGLTHLGIDLYVKSDVRERWILSKVGFYSIFEIFVWASWWDANSPIDVTKTRSSMSILNESAIYSIKIKSTTHHNLSPTSWKLLLKNSYDCASLRRSRMVPFLDCGWRYAMQYFPRNLLVLILMHWSKSPYWFTLPLNIPDGIFAVASCTENTQLHYNHQQFLVKFSSHFSMPKALNSQFHTKENWNLFDIVRLYFLFWSSQKLVYVEGTN